MIERRGLVIHPTELDDAWLDTFQSLGLNVLGLHPVGGANANQSLQQMIDRREQMRPLLDRARKMGLTVEYEMHVLSYLLPRDLFAQHPDWFRLNEHGERAADFNFCTGSETALDFLSQRAALLAQLLPSEDHLYYFWLDDVASYSCHCDHCRALSPSDQQMLAVNAIQRGIRTVDPQGCAAYLAYLDTLCPPEHVRPDEGVFLEYAPISRRLDRAICDPDCPENALQAAPLEALLDCFGKKNAKVLDYWTDNSLLSRWTYPPKPYALNAEVLRQDIEYYRGLGFRSITAFGCYLGKDYIDLHGQPDLSAYGETLSH